MIWNEVLFKVWKGNYGQSDDLSGCGCAQENNVQNNVQGNSVPQIKEALSDIQKEVWINSGWSLLGFFIPIVGLILYLVYKNSANNF